LKKRQRSSGAAPVKRAAAKKKAPPAPPPKKQVKTLDRVLSKLGICSRTESRDWIAQGRLQINGQTVRDPDLWVDLDRDRVALDGRPVRAGKKIYVLLYKPRGYLTTYTDPSGRQTVYDLLKEIDVRDAPHDERQRVSRTPHKPRASRRQDLSREGIDVADR
jgi:hypothetical protein